METTENTAAALEDARTGSTQQIPIDVYDIQRVVSHLATKALQLFGNFTTNLAEGWMNIRCKYDGGKVINRSQAGSWTFRCMGAGLQLNLGHKWGPKAFSDMTESPINPVYETVAQQAEKKIESDKKRKASAEAKERR